MRLSSMLIRTFFVVEYGAHMSWARRKYTSGHCVIAAFHASAVSLFHSVSLFICLFLPLRPSSLTGYLSWAWPCWLRGYDLTLQSLSSPHCCISLRHWRGTHSFTHYTPQHHTVQFTLKRSMLLRLRYMAHQSWIDNHALWVGVHRIAHRCTGKLFCLPLLCLLSYLVIRMQWF